jgi:Flp pilus assembly protein TadG
MRLERADQQCLCANQRSTLVNIKGRRWHLRHFRESQLQVSISFHAALLAATLHFFGPPEANPPRSGGDAVGDAVMSILRLPKPVAATLGRVFADDHASQIVEFAVSLPLLVLFVVGIFDFTGAITLKQKLTNAAREGARVAAADPANDLANSVPVSVNDARQVVDNYLLSEKINDCGLGSALLSSAGLTWTATTTGCAGAGNNIILTINRGCVTQESGSSVYTVNTCVTILYPYRWKFTGVSGLFSGKFTGPTGITTTAVAFNEN